MTHFSGHLRQYLYISFALLITACGGGDGGVIPGGELPPGGEPPAGCDTPLTVDYVNNEFLTEDLFVLGGFSASDTVVVHQDGNQGNTYDIDTIILSRVTHTSGNTLAISTSVHATSNVTSDTYMVFYVDVDKNATTGQLIDGIGADVLIIDNPPTNGASAPITARAQVWNGSSWVGLPKLGITSATASYFAGCTLGLSIYVPLSQDIELLYAKDVRGVMKLIRLTNGDPNTPVAEPAVDTTSVFDFMVP